MKRFGRVVLSLGLGLAALTAACEDSDDGDDTREGTGNPTSAYETTVEVTDKGINPTQLRLQANEEISLTVVNRSDTACVFYIENYLRELNAPAGQSATLGITIPSAQGQNQSDNSGVEMGCQGDEDRRGNVVILGTTNNPSGNPQSQ